MSDGPGNQLPKTCPHCSGCDLYKRRLPLGGGHGPYLLMGLGGFMHYAEFDVVVCADCGLTQLFATSAARANLVKGGWTRLG
jgi:hypothetical protein